MITDSLRRNIEELIEWSQETHNQLPWRRQRSLYGTLVSEIMLQQTTVATVLPKFSVFLKKFPDLESLAVASEEELVRAWEGLGYYRRARNLHKAAQFLVKECGGVFPDSVEDLMSIPGIGEYTAAALLAIGMDRPAFALDGNLKRVFARITDNDGLYGTTLDKSLKEQLAEASWQVLCTEVGPRQLNEALMDLGREICQGRKTYCGDCPIQSSCKTYELGKDPLLLPRRPEKKQKSFKLKLLRLLVEKEGKLLFYRKEKGEWLEGQWELPTFVLSSEDDSFSQYQLWQKEIPESVVGIKTLITKYRIDNTAVYAEEGFCDHRKTVYLTPSEVIAGETSEHISTACMKILKKLY